MIREDIDSECGRGIHRGHRDKGFDVLIRLKRPAEHATTLLRTLVEYYDVGKRCFTFNGRQLFFGLVDVLMITGLPISGKAITGKDEALELLCQQYLGSLEGFEKTKGGIRLKALRKRLKRYKDGEDVATYVRALVLYLIGSVITPSSNVVPSIFLQLMDDITTIKDYASGATLLAYLHVGLEKV
ncbi:hypothetical protein REPUB_Repub14bG0072000 [Reevesia pubescens]